LTLRYSRSTNTLSHQAPLPSMLIAMPLSASTPVKASPVLPARQVFRQAKPFEEQPIVS
jgi:hypothetical protein